jgi:uncharacterized membrane protein (DUF485 family)
MNDSIYLSIQNSPRFKELVSKRERFAWILSAIMLGLYSGFIVSAFVLTGIYVRRANGEFDDLNNAILKEAQQ